MFGTPAIGTQSSRQRNSRVILSVPAAAIFSGTRNRGLLTVKHHLWRVRKADSLIGGDPDHRWFHGVEHDVVAGPTQLVLRLGGRFRLFLMLGTVLGGVAGPPSCPLDPGRANILRWIPLVLGQENRCHTTSPRLLAALAQLQSAKVCELTLPTRKKKLSNFQA